MLLMLLLQLRIHPFVANVVTVVNVRLTFGSEEVTSFLLTAASPIRFRFTLRLKSLQMLQLLHYDSSRKHNLREKYTICCKNCKCEKGFGSYE